MSSVGDLTNLGFSKTIAGRILKALDREGGDKPFYAGVGHRTPAGKIINIHGTFDHEELQDDTGRITYREVLTIRKGKRLSYRDHLAFLLDKDEHGYGSYKRGEGPTGDGEGEGSWSVASLKKQLVPSMPRQVLLSPGDRYFLMPDGTFWSHQTANTHEDALGPDFPDIMHDTSTVRVGGPNAFQFFGRTTEKQAQAIVDMVALSKSSTLFVDIVKPHSGAVLDAKVFDQAGRVTADTLRNWVNQKQLSYRARLAFLLDKDEHGYGSYKRGEGGEHETTVHKAGKSVLLPGRYEKQKVGPNSLAVTSKNGYLVATKSSNNPDYVWVNHVRVKDAAQGKGEGTALYIAAMKAAQAQGMKGLLRGDLPGRDISSQATRMWDRFERQGLTEKVTATVINPDKGPIHYETLALVRSTPKALSYRETLAILLDWDEGLHPRDETGRFAGGSVSVGGREVGITQSEFARRAGNVIAPVNVGTFDQAWQQEQGFHVGPQGAGGIGTRYERVGEFLNTAKTMDAPEVVVREDGRVGFQDGRHRMAYLRDQGLPRVPVSMSKESLANARAHGLVGEREAKPVAIAKAVAAHKGMEMVSVEDLRRLATEDRRVEPKSAMNITERTETLLPRLTKELREGKAIQEPLVIAYDTDGGKALLADGNTRLAAIEDAGFTHAPVVISRQDTHGFGRDVPTLSHEQAGVKPFRNWLLPSEAGFRTLPKKLSYRERLTFLLDKDEHGYGSYKRGEGPGGDVFFHGTNEQSLRSILKDGLLTKHSGKIWPGESQQDKVYVATNEATALEWAGYSSRAVPNAMPSVTPQPVVILKIQVPAEHMGRVAWDTHSTYDPVNRQFTGDIPPEWIVGAKVGRPSKPDATVWDVEYQWEDVHLRATAGHVVYVVLRAAGAQKNLATFALDKDAHGYGSWKRGEEPQGESNADTAEAIPAGKQGECFRNAMRWARQHDYDLVHGKVTNGVGKTFDHAWAENTKDVVDPTTGVRMEKGRWYDTVHAQPEARIQPRAGDGQHAADQEHGTVDGGGSGGPEAGAVGSPRLGRERAPTRRARTVW